MKKKYSIFSHFKYIFHNYVKYDKGILLDVMIYLIAGVIVPLSGALLPVVIIGALERKIEIQNLLYICVVIFSFCGMMQYLYAYYKNKIHLRMVDSRQSIFDRKLVLKLMTIDYEILEKVETQTLLENASEAIWNGDFNGITGFFIHHVMLAENVLGLIVYSCFIGSLNIWIVVMLIGISLIKFVMFHVAKKYEDKHQDHKSKISIVIDYINKQASEIQSGKDIRLYQLSSWLMGILKSKQKDYSAIEFDEKKRYFASDFIGLALEFARDLVCYGYVFLMINDGMSVAMLVLYINMVRGFGSWVSVISDCLFKFYQVSTSISNFRSFVDYDGQIYPVLDENRLDQPWFIEFKDICFSYDQGKTYTINHLNLKIKENEKIAIVGLNGAGKTTLIKLLCGLYHPTSGQILINGIDIETIDRKVLHHFISVIFQDTNILALSVQENITLQNQEDMDENRMKEALMQSDFMDKVLSLPKQEKTFIYKNLDPDGVLLSGGEAQKLLCARALYKPSHLMILDEPTAALDALAESSMYEKYHQMTSDKTAIFISHRLASTKFCERIIYFENGNVEEMGTHDDLIQLHGKYAHLFDVQSQYYKEGGEFNHENSNSDDSNA